MGEDASGLDDTPRIVAVDILDGSDTKALAGDRSQYVNFPRDAKWVDASVGVRNEDRLGQKLRVKVRFDRPGSHKFKLKMDPSDGNEPYTGGEEGRNDNFLYQKEQKSYTTEGDGTKIVEEDFFVTCQGTDVFAVEAEDNDGNTTSSMEVEVQRLIYIVEVKMNGTHPASSINAAKGEFAAHGIKIEQLPSVTMPYMENVNERHFTAFMNSARSAFTGSEGPSKEPYVLCVVYAGHMAKKGVKTFRQKWVRAGPHAPNPIQTVFLRDDKGKPKYLWSGVETGGEDWFIEATFEDTEGNITSIDKVMITPIPDPKGPDIHSSVVVEVHQLPDSIGTLTLSFNCIKMRAGAAFTQSSLVAIATRAYWDPIPEATQNEIIVHEVGHRLNMVSDGSGKRPDRRAYYYYQHGPHCHNGIAPKTVYTKEDTTSATCVMFGYVSGNLSFCEECAPAVKKVDISDGWARW